jgi:RNA polymerase sigma factor (sigma-70 family)
LSAVDPKYSIDSLLLPYVQCEDEGRAEDLLSQLIEQRAMPVIKGVIKNKLRVSLSTGDGSHINQEGLDLQSEVTAQLIEELRECRNQGKAISNFQSYTAVISFHRCYEYLRRKHPERSGLKEKIRYLLSNRPQFALWDSETDGRVCGLREWREERVVAAETQLQDFEIVHQKLSAELLTTIFNHSGKPVRLDLLVDTVARITDTVDVSTTQSSAEEENILEQIRDEQPDILSVIEKRTFLRKLWDEICNLPDRQRAALLLSLRDDQGNSSTQLFPACRIASVRDIALAAGFQVTEFAALYNTLPLDDMQIANRLGVTRQQVINLRAAARERLGRKLKSLFG